MPLDAEDVALAGLEAKVRAEEARKVIGPSSSRASLTVWLPRAVIVRLRAKASERQITPSELVALALGQYLSGEQTGRRRR